MEELSPIDARSIPPTLSCLSDLAPEATEARIVGAPRDLGQTLPQLRLTRLWLQNMKVDAAARLAAHFDPLQLSLTNVQTPDLQWIRRQHRLTDLLIDWNSKLESFAFLRGAPPLRRLRADGLKALHHLDDLVHQPSLESLWIGGGIDRPVHIATLEPLAQLLNLEHLFLISMRLDEPSLAPLAPLRKLKRLRIQSNMAAMEEYARLAGALPDVHSEMLRGFMTLQWNLPPQVDLLDVIDELSGDEQVIMVGKGGRRFKIATDRQKIVDQLLRFRSIRDAERTKAETERRG
jgi:hypothetical protein